MKFLILLCLILVGCKKPGDSASPPPVDPVYGNWIYMFPSTSTTQGKGIYARLGSDGTILILNIYATLAGSSVTEYFRKSIGTYTRAGSKFSMKYSYETCNPVGTEELNAAVDPKNSDRIIVSNKDASIVFTMDRVVDAKSDVSVTAIEDKKCTLLAKLQKESRMPASAKGTLDYLK